MLTLLAGLARLDDADLISDAVALCSTDAQRSEVERARMELQQELDAATPAVAPRQTYATTVEQRLSTILKSALLIESALLAARSEDAEYDVRDYADAALEQAITAHEQAYWLTLLPADVLNMSAPDGDEQDRIDAATAGGAR